MIARGFSLFFFITRIGSLWLWRFACLNFLYRPTNSRSLSTGSTLSAVSSISALSAADDEDLTEEEREKRRKREEVFLFPHVNVVLTGYTAKGGSKGETHGTQTEPAARNRACLVHHR